jgi:hypothetical protein
MRPWSSLWGGLHCRILVGKPEGKRPLGRPTHKWVDNIKFILKIHDGVVWTGLIWGLWRVCEYSIMTVWVPQNVGKSLNRCTTGSFSRAQLHEVSKFLMMIKQFTSLSDNDATSKRFYIPFVSVCNLHVIHFRFQYCNCIHYYLHVSK